jgi:hypothetical protein
VLNREPLRAPVLLVEYAGEVLPREQIQKESGSVIRPVHPVEFRKVGKRYATRQEWSGLKIPLEVIAGQRDYLGVSAS